jgi:ectoine hydroxylase-related dioxygenase (phytanoyl-CoA dioxygenase family)
LLDRFWTRVRQRRTVRGFRSRFGGLWTDRLDALERLEEARRTGRVSGEDARALSTWITQGHWIVPGAVSPEWIERLNADVAELWARRDGATRVEIGGAYVALSPELRSEHCKLVDLYARSRAALEVALAPAITRFLRLVFEHEPLLFQSLSFERGSEQPIHQDTAYVVVTPAMAFAAAWIALEDIPVGSGELAYYPGSHALPEYRFRGGTRNWNRERDGLEAQERYQEWLLATLAARGIERQLLRPRKGDVLFWNADLAHGGSPILDRALTRRSLVCHYCPAQARPYYFSYRPDRRRIVRLPGAGYASSHYALPLE